MKKLLGLFIFVFLISFISADFTFDNTKGFNETGKYGTITIKNSFGLGDNLVSYTLTDNSDYCLRTCTAQGTVVFSTSAKLFDGVEFKNVATDSVLHLDYRLYISNSQESQQIVSPIYESSCVETIEKNSSISKMCENKLVEEKTETIQKDIWVEYGGQELLGEYKWKIEANKRIGVSLDWIGILDSLNIGDFKTEEWAIWTDSLSANIKAYYKLNESSGTVTLDSVTRPTQPLGLFNATNDITNFGQAGIIGTTYNFTAQSTTEFINLSNTLWNATGNFTLSLWLWMASNDSDNQYVFSFIDEVDGNPECIWRIEDAATNTFRIQCFTIVTEFNFPTVIYATNRWQHWVLQVTNDGAGNATIWANATVIDSDGSTEILNTTVTKNVLSRRIGGAGTGINGLMDEVGWWDRFLTPQEVQDLYNAGAGITYSFNDTSTATLTLISPEENLTTTNRTIVYNCNVTSTAGLYNLSLLINNSVTGLTISTSVQNSSPAQSNISLNFTSTYTNPRNDTWSCQSREIDGTSKNASFKSYRIQDLIEHLQTYNTSTYETSIETFRLNISTYNITDTTAELIYNSTNYGNGTKTTYGAFQGVFARNVSINSSAFNPINAPFYWRIYNGSTLTNSTNTTQKVDPIIFNLCNATLTFPYVNYTFKNEVNSSSLSASIPASTWYYWIANQSLNKTLTYSNNNANSSYGFCFYPQNRTVNTQYSLQYEATNYPQRIFSESTSFTNTTTNKTLYLLESGDGIFVTFVVINQANQPLENVFVNATRTIFGSSTLIGNGFTDAAGAITFWLSPDFSHTFCFEKSGFDLYCTSLFPTQSSYTVTLGDTTTSLPIYLQGITTSVYPKATQALFNNTVYQFNFTLNSTYWTVTEFGFTLRNATGTIFNVTSTTTNGGTLNVGLNTGNQTGILMDYYWIINNSYTNATVFWLITDTAGSEYSLRTFFNRLSTYLVSGLFGLNNFGLTILIFLTIFITTGVLSYKFGITSSTAIVAIIASMVFIFDFGLSLIPNPIGAIPYFPTFFVGIILLILVIRENTFSIFK